MIAPIDIEKKDFSKSLNGYNKDEVDNFLNHIIMDIEEYQKTIAKLQSEQELLRQEISEYHKQQSSLTETLASTKSLLADISDSAEKRAALILKSAETEANTIVSDAKLSVANSTKEMEMLRSQIKHFRERYKKMLQDELSSFQEESMIFVNEIDKAFIPASMSVEELPKYDNDTNAETSTKKLVQGNAPKSKVKNQIDFSPLNDNKETKIL